MLKSHNLGYPRIGNHRETKFIIEKFWKKECSQAELEAELASIRKANWQLQKEKCIDLIPSNDFSAYDQVLDMICLLGAIPERYKGLSGLDLYYSMARGSTEHNVVAMEMTKWFDTNYHYIVPEFQKEQSFALSSEKIFAEFAEAKNLGIITKPVILGPVSFLSLGKEKSEFNRFDLLAKLLPVYGEILRRLSDLGAEYIQLDEPCLVTDLTPEQTHAYGEFQRLLREELGSSFESKIILTTYFEGIADNIDLILQDAIWDTLHIDLCRRPDQLGAILEKLPEGKSLSLGLIDGRNIWKNDLHKSLELVSEAKAKLGKDNLMIAPSCSLLHVPVDLDNEKSLDGELKDWLSFAVQKLEEVKALTDLVNEKDDDKLKAYLKANQQAHEKRRSSKRIHLQEVKERASKVTEADTKRSTPFSERMQKQKQSLNLPLFPTTTIGSFPQTKDVRAVRAKFKRGELSDADYQMQIKEMIEQCIRWQEEINMDVLVHGEFERNDMVEYFGQFLSGFATSENAWVQSYGTRCVKPPVIYGDVRRLKPMTVEWTAYAQSLTDHPVKGMLTGPVTIAQWSFVRDDQPRSETVKQIALAILDEVRDLQNAGIKVIQIDEPAYREGLPLRDIDKMPYLQWAAESFRLSSSADIADETQIHTHMCYSEFNDIISNIADMDADVITIETARSEMEILEAFEEFNYPNQVGPGVYDVHSERIPSIEEMKLLLTKSYEVLPRENIWVNPDCGLKTRTWQEVKPALENMIKAAQSLR